MTQQENIQAQANPKTVKDLVRALNHLRSQQGRLLAVIEEKADAMRRADTTTMQAQSQRELLILSRIEQYEKDRCGLARQLGVQLGLAAVSAHELTMSRLAIRCPAAMRRELLEAGEALHQVVFRVQRANRVAGVASREILNHMKYVFAAARPAGAAASGYGGDGVATQPPTTQIFETVG